MSLIWVDKYKPRCTPELIGQSKNVSRIKSWLKTFDPSRSKPLFIFGPPGIGKTTAAHLCCKEVGYRVVEFNASDQRNKNIIKDVISTLGTNSRISFTMKASETKSAIILDEIDGMAGNEDRGGIGQLIIEMRTCKKPMIFICNDGQHQKLRSLKDKCETIEFRKPDFEAIRAVVSKIAKAEGLKVDQINVKNLADSSDYDIRQILNSLHLFKNGNSTDIAKTTRINAFEATKQALTASNHTIDDLFGFFFADYNIMPLFIFENYPRNRPASGDQLKAISRAADSICLGDLVEKQIRSNQNWSLLNTHALYSTVIPAKLTASRFYTRTEFPQFLGKLSNANKRLRLAQELNAHMCLTLRGGLDADILDTMRERLVGPLMKQDVDSTIDFMDAYSLLRDDFDSILELATWSFKPAAKIDTKVKTKFTNSYKKRSIKLPYFHDEKMPKKREIVDMGDREELVEEEEEEDDKKKKEPDVVPKRKFKSAPQASAKASAKAPAKASAKAPAKAPAKTINGFFKT